MAINTNVEPYYDDFDSKKNFHRILFKPGYAVQARELTQAQTILQDQISKFGNGIFADGSKISGANITVDYNVITCKLTVDSSSYIKSLVGLFAVGQTSNFISEVIEVDSLNFYIATKAVNVANSKSFASGETIKFYSSKLLALTSLNAPQIESYTATALTTNTLTVYSTGTHLTNILSIPTGNITVGDSISIPDINFNAKVSSIVDGSTIVLSSRLPRTVSNLATTITNEISVRALQVGIDDGVWFTNGFFVANYASHIIPDLLNVSPTVVVGFEVDETIIDSYNDASLLDPAIGASNYQAPGADRYNITLNLVTKPYVSDQTVASLTNVKFIELVRINAGVVEDITNVPNFTSVSKAISQAVSDISGDFVVNPFSLLIGENATATNNFISLISAGKAYIDGKSVEHISSTQKLLEKSRDTHVLSSQSIGTYYGNYTTVKNLKGSIINFQQDTQVQLHNAVSSLANTNTIIGTARIRGLDYDSGNNSSSVYKSFLWDVNLTNNTFSNVKSMIVPGAGNNYTTVSFSANTETSSNLVDNLYTTLMFPLQYKNISNVSNINYVTNRYFTAPTFTNGSYTITTNGINETFIGGDGTLSAPLRQLNFAVVTTSASGSYTSGQFIPMDQANVTITINNTAGTPQATINIGGNFSGSATILSTISVQNDNLRSKVLNKNSTALVSANTKNTPIDIGKSDIYTFNSVFELGNTYSYIGTFANTTTYAANNAVFTPEGNVYISLVNSNVGNQPNTSPTKWSVLPNHILNYKTNDGQRDTHYDHGTITNTSGVSKGNVVVVFDYFTHSGGIGAFTVNSYPLDYATIPSYTSQQYGSLISLRDVIDFRPRRTDGIGVTTFDSHQLPAPLETEYVYANYGYYLSRIDKIVLYKNGQFKTLRGTSSYNNPVPPSDIPGALTLFTIQYPAYTFSKNDVLVRPTKLRRYTMRDIGVLDNRISNLEYYTSLSLLEKEVKGKDVTDSTGQQILFKNGFLVDSFSGQNVGDVNNSDYAISMDFTNQFARPLFTSNVANYYVDTNQGKFVTSPGKTNNKLSIKDNIITFSYDEQSLVDQNVATQIINVNPFNVVNYVGSIKLSPSSDVWYDSNTKPNINILTEDQSAWAAAVNGTGHGTQWNDWQINWTGQGVEQVSPSDISTISRDTDEISKVIASKGLTAALNGGNIQVSSDTKIVSEAIIPYCRSTDIRFEINGLSPQTELHTFVEGICVDSYVSPDANSTSGIGSISLVNAGVGYTNGNNLPIIQITGANTYPAQATANVVGGAIDRVNIISFGSGYTDTPTITVIGSNTVQAVLSCNGSSYLGSPLVSNKQGKVSGTLTIPNDEFIKIPTGSLSIEFTDNFLNPVISSSYAKTSFTSIGTLQTKQTIITSTRPPAISQKPQVIDRNDNTPTNTTYDPGDSGVTVVTDTTITPTDNRAFDNSPLNPGSSTYTKEQGNAYFLHYGDKLVADITGKGNSLYLDVATNLAVINNINSAFDPFYNALSASKTGDSKPTGDEMTAALMYGTNLVLKDGLSVNDAISKVVEKINDLGSKTSEIATQYLTNNSTLNNSAQQEAFAFEPGGGVASCAVGDPLSQNFFVSASIYPNGIFLSSVDLYFATKDDVLPVSIEIRPTVNGYPDAVNMIVGSNVYKNPDQVNTPLETNITKSIGPKTTFTFDHPIYLKPGQHTLMIASNSNKYNVYSSKLGQAQYGSGNIINQLNYIASLFKSQNASTWVAAPGETLCFNLKICDFAGGYATFDITSNSSSSAIEFDMMQLMTQELSFSDVDSINYQVLTKDSSTNTQSGPITVKSGSNYNFLTRQKQSSSGDIIVRPTLTNIDRWTSPVIDMERLNTILVKNIITPYYSANTISESLGGSNNGGASARYITRRVTLNNNFESTGLTVYLDVNRQPGTYIEVYYKVMNTFDSNDFDNNPYVLMSPVLIPGSGLSSTGSSDYTSDMYQALNIQYNDINTGTLYTNFNIFAIKIVMYSSNPAVVPQIKNFRAIATA